uniref:Uncharacterized protein n=1 Tax=Steinernema glaseri TaxID=37863 RepID=A0A1I8A611_9BILA
MDPSEVKRGHHEEVHARTVPPPTMNKEGLENTSQMNRYPYYLGLFPLRFDPKASRNLPGRLRPGPSSRDLEVAPPVSPLQKPWRVKSELREVHL